MAARARLGLLAAAVVAAHLLALDRLAQGIEHASILQATSQPMFTRLLRPEAPPPPPPKAKPAPPRRAVREHMAAALPQPTPAASASEAVTTTVAQTPEPPPAESPIPVPAPPQAAASPPSSPPPAEAVAATAQPPASAASAAAADTPSLDAWPTDTRLSYRLTGMFRGQLYGDARVQWQREGANYQVRLDIDISPWVTMVITSQGEVTPTGLAPRAYEEQRRGKRRWAKLGERSIQMENGKVAARPPGVQDTASQFVELAHRFASGIDTLEVGSSVTFWMARPTAVDQWTYDIVERVVLDTPELGRIEAFHLKPRPLENPRGNITAEMWFAPALQYLPVRIKVNMGEEAWVDLLVEKIEQR